MPAGRGGSGLDRVVLAAVPDRLPVVWPEEFRKSHAQLFAGQPGGFVNSTPDADSVIRTYTPGGSLAAGCLNRTQLHRSNRGCAALLRWRGNLEQLREREN
jgi:hypothetical protein